jgi:hypothetical protein
LQLTGLGRLVGWLAVSLLAIGLFFTNQAILAMAAACFLLLLVEAVAFRRTVGVARRSITVLTEPANVEAVAERQTQTRTTIRNSSRLTFPITEIKRIHPPEIEEVLENPKLISRRSEHELKVFLKANVPGKFETEGTELSLIGGRGLFRQSLQFQDRVIMVSYPIPSRMNTLSNVTGISDLAVDPLRRGSGTDLAGLRPSSFLEDFHRIDWKATARTGQVTARDFLAEKDPTIMLLIDVSALKHAIAGTDRTIMLTQFSNLFSDPFVAMSPIGLIMFDERNIVARLEPQIGPEGRRELRRMLLEKISEGTELAESVEDTSRSYVELLREKQTLTAQSTRPIRSNPFAELVESLAQKILPFYDVAISTHLHRVRNQGAFKAFEVTATLTEPMLLVCVTDRNSKVSGLYEGARLATEMNHHIIIAVVESFGKAESTEPFLDLANIGIHPVTTTPDELWRRINKELQSTRERRTLAGRTLQWIK